MTQPVVDAHHHIWRQQDLPWLVGPMVPRIIGPYEAIRRDYPIVEFLKDVAGSGVVKSVYVQANWGSADDEAAWVSRVAAETGWPHAIVGYADFMAEDVRPALDRLAGFPLMRGVRMQIHWHENPQYRFARSPDVADDPKFRRNIAALAGYGLSFDLQVFAAQMAGAARLAADHPRTTFILQHAGMLEDRSPEGIAAWRKGMALLAAEPNVVAKLSAFGTFIHRNDPGHIAFVVGETVKLFGADRCLYGSNFPIEKLWTAYGPLIDAHKAAALSHGEAAARAILHDTAVRVYRLD